MVTNNNRQENFFKSKLNDEGFAVLKLIDFEEIILIEDLNEIKSKELTILSDIVRKHGLSIEPDINYQNLKMKGTDTVVLFREDYNPGILSNEYKYASLLIKVGCLISSYDGVIDQKEIDGLLRFINKNIALPDYELNRLKALVKRMLSTTLNLKMFQVKLKDLNEYKRKELVKFAKEIIVIDGYIDNREVSLLNNIYKLFSDDNEEIIDRRNTKRELMKFAKDNAIRIKQDNKNKENKVVPAYMLKDDSLLDELLEDFGF